MREEAEEALLDEAFDFGRWEEEEEEEERGESWWAEFEA